MKNSNNFIISIISLIHYSFSLFLPGLFPVFMGMVNVNSPGIHVLTRLISRRDKASDRIMSHGLALQVHLWKQDPFFFRASKRMLNDRKLLGRIFYGGWSIFRSKALRDTRLDEKDTYTFA